MKTSYTTQAYIRIYFSIVCLHKINGKLTELQKIEYCQNLRCDETETDTVCGIRKQNGKNAYRVFDNECFLLKYGCQVKDAEEAYGIINMKYCIEHTPQEKDKINCTTHCASNVKKPVCGIRKNGEGFSVKLFSNECQLSKYNCKKQLQFNVTDIFICNGLGSNQLLVERRNEDREDKDYTGFIKDDENNSTNQEIDDLVNPGTISEEANNTEINIEETEHLETIIEEINTEELNTEEPINKETDSNETSYTNDAETNDLVTTTTTTSMLPEPLTTNTPQMKNQTILKNIIVIRGSMSDMQNINTTAENFFAATHVFDLPIREMQPNLTERTRRMLVKVFGPVKVFTPWLKIPSTINEDRYHKPTLSSCFHKCPTKCPDTYAPVCGVPGIVAREPSLMFQNHCFMDVAQCKMFWEDKSWTSESSAYIESSFLFCLGNELNGLYRFLPLIRTLQHMGRLKSKGKFKYKMKNMRFFNQLLDKQPSLMGK